MLDRRDVPLAPLTTLRLGGPARRLVTVYDEPSLIEVVQTAAATGEPLLVLGGGSNVVLSDGGFDGTVVRIALHGLTGSRHGRSVRLTAAAGEDWESFVALSVTDGLVGLEALSGIPGLVGASPIQNVGAYGQEVCQTITAVRAYDRVAAEVVTLSAEQCRFAYRQSVFKATTNRWVVLAVTFELEQSPLSAPVRYAELARTLGVAVGACAPASQVRDAVLRLRRSKGMVLDDADPDTRSAGSFFTNPRLSSEQARALRARVEKRLGAGSAAPEWPEADGQVKISAAWLIEQAGFTRGSFDGPVGISSKHTLALVHRGGGRTADLLAVAREIRTGVRESFGVELIAEPVLVGDTL